MDVPLDGVEFDRWMGQSASARRMVELARRSGEHAWACFLAEQAAQFAVKALLHGLGLDAWGHDLVRLVDRGRSGTGDWEVDLDAVVRLARLYIPTRYPDASASDPGASYREADSVQATSDADGIVASVNDLWARLAEDRTDESG